MQNCTGDKKRDSSYTVISYKDCKCLVGIAVPGFTVALQVTIGPLYQVLDSVVIAPIMYTGNAELSLANDDNMIYNCCHEV